MARARNLKPGFFRNADLLELPFEARLLFAGLWTLADREGRLEDKPKQIKIEIFPADNVDCDALLNAIAATGMLKRYVVDGKRYLQVVNFAKHQNPHRDEKTSMVPAEHGDVADSEAIQMQHCANTVQTLCSVGAPTVAIGLTPVSLTPSTLIPDTLQKSPRKRDLPRPDDVAEQVWNDWVEHRHGKRAKVSPTVVAEARSEAAKAGVTLERFLTIWCARGSQGLEANWLKPNERASPQQETPYQRSMRERVAEFSPGIARQAPGQHTNPTTLDMELPDVLAINRY